MLDTVITISSSLHFFLSLVVKLQFIVFFLWGGPLGDRIFTLAACAAQTFNSLVAASVLEWTSGGVVMYLVRWGTKTRRKSFEVNRKKKKRKWLKNRRIVLRRLEAWDALLIAGWGEFMHAAARRYERTGCTHVNVEGRAYNRWFSCSRREALLGSVTRTRRYLYIFFFGLCLRRKLEVPVREFDVEEKSVGPDLALACPCFGSAEMPQNFVGMSEL